MPDFRSMTDEQLRAWTAPAGQPPADVQTPVANAVPDFRSMTDEQLMAWKPSAPQTAVQGENKPTFSGTILPFSKDAQGNVSFDSNAGLIGMAKNAIGMGVESAALPGRVMQEAATPRAEVSDSDVSAMSVPSVMGLASMGTPVNPAVRAGDRAIPGLAKARMAPESAIKPPTAQVLKDTAGKGYDAARNMGVEVRGDAVGGMARNVQSTLEQDGIFAELAPKTFSILKRVTDPPKEASATIANMEAIRRSLQRAGQDFTNPTEQLAASRVIKGLDEFLGGLGPGSTVVRPPSAAPGVVALPSGLPPAGRPEAVAELLKTSRQNYGAAQRSNSLTGALDRANTGILERAEVRAQAANSGRNLDNTIRSKIASLLEKPKEVSGFSDAELAALNKAIDGGPVRNTARMLGNLLGGGGGIGQFGVGAVGAGTGLAYGGIPGAIIGATPAVAGVGAKKLANILAKRSLTQADEAVRANSPLFREMLKNAPKAPANLDQKAAIAKLLLMNALNKKQ